jgi:hypothetical protein
MKLTEAQRLKLIRRKRRGGLPEGGAPVMTSSETKSYSWIKHGKHNQASHGRKTARRRAYSAAYSSARAGGATPAEARAKAKDAGLARQAERDTRLERLRAYNTPEARAERERAAQQQSATLLANPTRQPLPEISASSDKQRSFAESVRERKLRDAERVRKEQYENYRLSKNDPNAAALLRAQDRAIDLMREKTDARYWLDNKDLGATVLMNRILPERSVAESQATRQRTVSPLPSLRASSDKQRTFAESVRERKTQELEQYRAELVRTAMGRYRDATQRENEIAKIDARIDRVRNRDDARYWLDNKDEPGWFLYREIGD